MLTSQESEELSSLRSSKPGAKAVAGYESPPVQVIGGVRPRNRRILLGTDNVFWCSFFRLSTSAARAGDPLE
jgi:hypothetical protein